MFDGARGACELVCPSEAIFYEDDLPENLTQFTADNALFFTEVLPGRDEPVGSPTGARMVGAIGVDTNPSSETTQPSPTESRRSTL